MDTTNPREKYLISIPESYFVKLHGSNWFLFSSDKKKSIRHELLESINEAIVTGKELKNVPPEVSIIPITDSRLTS